MKTDRNNGSLSVISLTECQEAFQKGNLENKHVILTFTVADDHARSVDSYMYWDFPDFWGGTFSLTMKPNRSVLSDSDGGSI